MSASSISLARGRVRALCHAGLDADAFRRALRQTLHAVVPFDGYCVNTADPLTLMITSSVGDGLSAADATRLFAFEATGSDEAPLRELARAPIPVTYSTSSPENESTITVGRCAVEPLSASIRISVVRRGAFELLTPTETIT